MTLFTQNLFKWRICEDTKVTWEVKKWPEKWWGFDFEIFYEFQNLWNAGKESKYHVWFQPNHCDYYWTWLKTQQK